MNMDIIPAIAKVCHEANRAYCQTIGDYTQDPWDRSPDWQKDSAINGVKFHIQNPEAGPEGSHDNWMKVKVDAGWKYGPVKDAENKMHPCLRPYAELPPEQRMKDAIFVAIVHAFSKP